MFLIKNIKILSAVIKGIAIYMVHLFPSLKFATKMLFHNKAMLGDFPTSPDDIAIGHSLPIGVGNSPTFIGGIVFPRIYTALTPPLSIAGFATGLFGRQLAAVNCDRFVANKTFPLNHISIIEECQMKVNSWRPTKRKK